MNFIKTIFVAAIIIAATPILVAQAPKWIGNTPHELNNTYKFVEITTKGQSLENARSKAKAQLVDDESLLEGVRAQRRDNQKTTIEKERIDAGPLKEVNKDYTTIEIILDGKAVDLQANRIDEYFKYNNGVYELHTLYQVATCENPTFDKTYISTSYGMTPILMSIIPGMGQIYKGSKIKGISLFAAEAAAVAGIIVCENQRATYVKKAKEQPKFVKEYTNKANNYETGRNITIGIAGAIWIYNIIDAAVAKGCRYVKVNENSHRSFAVAPFVIPNYGTGITLALNF